jgi:hypothetical protein
VLPRMAQVGKIVSSIKQIDGIRRFRLKLRINICFKRDPNRISRKENCPDMT